MPERKASSSITALSPSKHNYVDRANGRSAQTTTTRWKSKRRGTGSLTIRFHSNPQKLMIQNSNFPLQNHCERWKNESKLFSRLDYISQDNHSNPSREKAPISTEANRDSSQYLNFWPSKFPSMCLPLPNSIHIIPQIRRHTSHTIKSDVK
jgi:hypothetical protein